MLVRNEVEKMSKAKDTDILDVLVIGVGFGGIGAGIELKRRGIENFLIVEKADEIGGTWYENRYPGAACDVESHFYCYSFEPNPNWTRKYSPQKEILAYIHHCADKYGLRPFIQLRTKVEKLVLDEEKALWQIHMAGGEIKLTRHVINAMGGLHAANIPDLPGAENFAGPIMHTAQWDESVEFEDKKALVIGSAASAIQLIPELAKSCKKLTVFQRTANYIMPRNDRDYRPWEKKWLARLSWLHRFYRWFLYKRLDLLIFPLTRQESKLGVRATKLHGEHMRAQIIDPQLHEKLDPPFTIGCKRILISDDYYNALNRDNVELVTDGIEKIEAGGIQDQQGKLHEGDILIYATGYDLTGHRNSIEMVGRDGVSMAQLGPEGELAYKGAVHSQYPNFYWITGPNTGVGTTSVVFMIEHQLNYIIQLIEAAGFDGKMIAVKEAALLAYNQGIQERLEKSVWASGCDSWYLREDGKNVTLYPGSAAEFAREHKKADLENFDFFESNSKVNDQPWNRDKVSA